MYSNSGRQAPGMHAGRDVHSVPCDCYIDSGAPPGLDAFKLPSSSWYGLTPFSGALSSRRSHDK